MKPKTMILMVVAVVCGLGASYMTSRLLAERGTEVVETPKVSVLVAKKNLDQGTAVKDKTVHELFEVKNFTKGEEPQDALNSFEQLKDKFVKHNLRKGDFVTPKDLQEDQIAIDLPPGMRAVGVRVNLESIAGGFASLPGSRVDIYSTVRRGTDDDSQSMLLLEDVLVLAADQHPTPPGAAVAMPATVVTVALNPDDVPRVNLAKEYGTLALVLRRLGDKSKSPSAKFTGADLWNNKARPSEITKGDGSDPVPSMTSPAPQAHTPAPQPQPATSPQQPLVSASPQHPLPAAPAPQVPSLQQKPALKPYTVYVRMGSKTVTRTYFQDEDGEIVSEGDPRLTEAQGAPGQQPAAGQSSFPTGAGSPPALSAAGKN
jgi:pilus assembly protein CpaB